ncbi:MAG: SDR family oxidoreductase [Candidatus Eremiobacteraeota bacterium]|nr:SDR family oxidoreductase [Candidatus Eremiobacteraeota bacterium]
MSLAIDLSGRVAFVSGGSSGIGAATVRTLHAAGASVFFTYLRHEQRAQSLAQELGSRVAYIRCDTAVAEALPDIIAACVRAFGRLDILVNNAAGFAENPFAGDDYAAWQAGWRKTFDSNLFGAANLAWLAMRQMRKQGDGGRIINVTSRAAHRGELTFADYGASKAALGNFTKSIARACAHEGITALAVAPGWIDTDMAADDLRARRAAIEAEIPLGYVAQPEEVASIIAFAASPLATYANGATIDVNGASYVR